MIDVARFGTDSTIVAPPNPPPPPPREPAIPFNERFMAARHEEGCYENNFCKYVLVCKGLSNDDIEVARGTVFQKIRPGAGGIRGNLVFGVTGRKIPHLKYKIPTLTIIVYKRLTH